MTAISRREFVVGAPSACAMLAGARRAPAPLGASARYLHARERTGSFARALRRAGLLGGIAGVAPARGLPGPCIAVGPWGSARAQLAFAEARGAADLRGTPWGVAFSPEGPTGRTCFSEAARADDAGPHLGPSSALHRRVLVHAWMAGAGFVFDAAGPACLFAEPTATALTSYGRAVREFLTFVQRHPDLGQPWTPLALRVEDSAARRDLEAALFPAIPTGDAEAAVLAPAHAPETFDVLPPVATARQSGRYRAVLALRSGDGLRAVEEARRWCPFERETDGPLQVRWRSADATWVVAVHNPRGARRADPLGLGSALDPACVLHERLTPRFRVRSVRAIAAWPGGTRATLRRGAIECAVGPGGVLIVEAVGDPWPLS